MRLAFVRALINSAKKNKNIHLLTGDLGFEVFEEFIEKFPNKFTNGGDSEANLVGAAAGMAHEGFKCICYSIVPFLTFRALEQIRNDVCYHNLDVKIVGVGAGFSYSWNGQSHVNIEDIAVMRVLPNMSVICPGDPLETYMATKQMLEMKGPVYLRLGKKGEPNLMYEHISDFQIGKIVEVKKGRDIVIFSTGNMLETTMQVVEELEKKGIEATHIHVHTIKPIDKEKISEVIRSHQKLVTIEEHSIIGGLASAISEVNSGFSKDPKELLAIGIEDFYFNTGGTQNFLREKSGLDPSNIAKKIQKWM